MLESLTLAQAAFFRASRGVSDQQQSTDHTRADGVHDRSCDALGKDQVYWFLIDENIQYRSNHNPCNGVTNYLDHIESDNILGFEFTFFDLRAFE